MPKRSYHRVDQLMPLDGTILITGPAKVGKTTLSLNLAASLITGKAFLGRYAVAPIAVDSRVVIFNYGMSEQMYVRWLTANGVPLERICMKSTPALVDSSDPFEEIGKLRFRAETLIIDPSSYDAAVQSLFITAVYMRKLGVRDVVLIDSNPTPEMLDTVDSTWTLRRSEYANRRYFSVDGRDSYLADTLLTFDPETRKLFTADSYEGES